MYPAEDLQDLVHHLQPLLVSALRLKRYNIYVHVCSSLEEKEYHGLAGLCTISGRVIDIWVFWDNVIGRKDAIGTIVHEFLHAKLKHVVSPKCHRGLGYAREERLVRDLENLVKIFL